ncbi:FAD-dependent monooxygenase [Nocardioides sp. Kera G14]|uniref:FAD-dependent monooxygenase n=1 Tax=Nocardioides sp. Kera G14 TaxID=2884264 RepID=UPI001D12A9F4|nr:FAD-dependent monooxygenase [Nocardioides sp. Kera G14]UDY23461.1 FAD-dependent monooxygenase [Nocardioides sp. Kera G14]
MRTLELDVFVVGAGPTGLSTAALLARSGATVAAITRYAGLANSPRAHIINQRTMEVFRDLGLEQRVADAAMPASLMGQVVWMESFAGPEIARRRGWGAGADRLSDYAAASPCVPTNIPQQVLEPILADAVREFGGEVIFNLELVSMRDDGDRVVSQCRDRITGEEVEVVSRYAVGADGDNSVVCRELGFEVEGASGLGHMVNYWIEADLTAYAEHRPGALYVVFRPGGPMVDNAVFVNVRPWHEWVMSIPYDPEAGELDRSEAEATRLARRYVGDDSLELRLIGASTWTVNQVFAPLMHRGRVVIAGNAAHRHPPAGGLGANTCVQDAFNLAWKLQLLLDDEAGTDRETLLGSYTDERAPVARQIVERANASFAALMAIPGAIGLRPGQAVDEAEAALASRFSAGPDGAARRAALAEALVLQDENFNALGVELGQRYVSATIVSDGSAFPTEPDEALSYTPSSVPGSPLPHAWLTRGRELLSSHDVVGRGRFTLLTGIGGERWLEAAGKVAADLGVDLDCVAIGPGLEVEDPYGDWAQLRGTSADGCLLVRPDRYTAFRAASLADDPETTLRRAVETALGRRSPEG